MSSTVARATQIIEKIGEGPCTTQEVAGHFAVHPSTVLRQLQTLAGAGFLVRYADGSWAIGPRLIAIAQRALDDLDLRRVAHDPIRALQSRTGHTVHLAQRTDDEVVYVDKVEDRTGVRLYSRIGLPVRVNCTGVGKAVLAHVPEQQRRAMLAHADWTRHTSTTLGPEQLGAQLEEIVDRGWAADAGEFEDYVNCIAAPVLSSTGTALGAVSVTSLKAICDLDGLQDFLPDLLRTAADIGEALG